MRSCWTAAWEGGAGQPQQGVGWERQEGRAEWADGGWGQLRNVEAQGHGEDTGVLPGAQEARWVPRGSCPTPLTRHSSQEDGRSGWCCGEVGGGPGSLLSQPTDLPSGHGAHLPCDIQTQLSPRRARQADRAGRGPSVSRWGAEGLAGEAGTQPWGWGLLKATVR